MLLLLLGSSGSVRGGQISCFCLMLHIHVYHYHCTIFIPDFWLTTQLHWPLKQCCEVGIQYHFNIHLMAVPAMSGWYSAPSSFVSTLLAFIPPSAGLQMQWRRQWGGGLHIKTELYMMEALNSSMRKMFKNQIVHGDVSKMHSILMFNNPMCLSCMSMSIQHFIQSVYPDLQQTAIALISLPVSNEPCFHLCLCVLLIECVCVWIIFS